MPQLKTQFSVIQNVSWQNLEQDCIELQKASQLNIKSVHLFFHSFPVQISFVFFLVAISSTLPTEAPLFPRGKWYWTAYQSPQQWNRDTKGTKIEMDDTNRFLFVCHFTLLQTSLQRSVWGQRKVALWEIKDVTHLSIKQMLAHGLLPLQELSYTYGPPDGTKTRPIIGRWQLLKSGLQATRGFEFVKLNNLLRNWLYDVQFVYRRNDGSSQLYMSSYLSPQFKHIHLHSSPFSGILRTNNETSSQLIEHCIGITKVMGSNPVQA